MEIIQSPIPLLMNVIGKKWAFEILNALMYEELHFSELEKMYSEMSGKMLSRRLKELFDLGLVGKIISNLTPLEFKYQVSDKGKELRKIFYEMAVFGTKLFREDVLKDPNVDTHEISAYFGKIYSI